MHYLRIANQYLLCLVRRLNFKEVNFHKEPNEPNDQSNSITNIICTGVILDYMLIMGIKLDLGIEIFCNIFPLVSLSYI